MLGLGPFEGEQPGGQVLADLRPCQHQFCRSVIAGSSCREVEGEGGVRRDRGDGEMSAKTNVFTALAVTDEPSR